MSGWTKTDPLILFCASLASSSVSSNLFPSFLPSSPPSTLLRLQSSAAATGGGVQKLLGRRLLLSRRRRSSPNSQPALSPILRSKLFISPPPPVRSLATMASSFPLYNAASTIPSLLHWSSGSHSDHNKLISFSPLRARRNAPRAAASADSGDGAPEAPKPARRGRKKSTASVSLSPSRSPTPVKRTRRSKKSQQEEEGEKEQTKVEKNVVSTVAEGDDTESEEDFDDGMDFPYESPPLVCCFGAARREFLPTVRVSERQMHPDQYSTWKQLQWNPPEFARAPGGPPSNVAISHVRLGGRAAFMGKVGDDDFGNDLLYRMNLEKVQTRAVKIDPAVKTAASYMKLGFQDAEDGAEKRLVADTVRGCAEDSFLKSEVDVAVLKEARIFHFNSEVLLSPSLCPALFRAIALSKKYESKVLFDLNLPLPLWRSKEKTKEVIKKAWSKADLIEVSKQELEFLLDENYYEKKRNYRPQYYSKSYEETKNRRNYYHYTREEIAPLWHDGIKILFVTDGTLRIHYYTPNFDGAVVGTEDVLITPFTCDRTGSGDAVVAAIMRKLTMHPEMYEDQDLLERQLRFAVAAGIIAQWTIGAVRGFPTESATKNLKEQVYVPSMW